MRSLSLSSMLALSGLAFGAIDFSKWAPPGPKDIRGPCPAMNSMANHDIIPHNGRNMTVPVLVKALGETFNLSPELAGIVSQLGVNTAPDPSQGSFKLSDLNKHNAFEHDASMSRVDFYHSGEEGIAKFDQRTFDRFMSHFKGMEYISIEAAAAARYSMVQYSRKNTPGFTYTQQHQITSYAEVIKFFKTMVDPANGQCKKQFVKILFEQERLPFREGWRPPKDQVNGFVMADMVLREALATPEKSSWFGETPTNDFPTHDIPTCKNPRFAIRGSLRNES